MTTLDNRQYFPAFCELPLMDEFCDPSYYIETADGKVVPTKTWCFFAEIVDNSLSQMPEFFHRVEVRDISGESTSVLFSSDEYSFDFRRLKCGSTVFVRYAAKCYFSDLMTQVLKVDDMDFVKVISQPLDILLCFSSFYYGMPNRCLACGGELNRTGGNCTCEACQAANYCNQQCRQRHLPEHQQHCAICQELGDVVNVDFERFLSPVPFR